MATNIVVPELGESVVEARVARWLKKPGDSVVAGDALVELETEKIDLEVSADRAGVLGVIRHQEGADVKVGEVLATLDEALAGTAPEVPEAPRVQEPQAAEKKATPTAKNVARAHDVKLDSVETLGARVTKQDVLKAAAPAAAPKAPEAPKAPAPAPQAPSAPKAPAGDRRESRGLYTL